MARQIVIPGALVFAMGTFEFHIGRVHPHMHFEMFFPHGGIAAFGALEGTFTRVLLQVYQKAVLSGGAVSALRALENLAIVSFHVQVQ